MGKAEELRNAVSTIKEYCDNRKCIRGEACLFCNNQASPPYCILNTHPLYWQSRKVKTRREVYLEKFPNALLGSDGNLNTCAQNVFGCVVACNTSKSCGECWDEPAPDEYQEELE